MHLHGGGGAPGGRGGGGGRAVGLGVEGGAGEADPVEGREVSLGGDVKSDPPSPLPSCSKQKYPAEVPQVSDQGAPHE